MTDEQFKLKLETQITIHRYFNCNTTSAAATTNNTVKATTAAAILLSLTTFSTHTQYISF